MRREISRSWLSLTAAGAVRSELSIVITTSAWLRAGRLPEPAKITASMSAARSDLCEASPIAQRRDKVGIAAAVRTDNPGKAGFDHKVSGFNERLETMEAKTREFHKSRILCWQGANLPCPTIP